MMLAARVKNCCLRHRAAGRPAISRPAVGRAGFTLIEIALAALVIGLAVLTLFGLARVGANAAAEAEDEVRAALFAENVFGALAAENNSLNMDTNFWREFKDGNRVLDDAARDMWLVPEAGAEPGYTDIVGDGRRRTNYYFSVSHRGSAIEGIPEARVVYRLRVALSGGEPTPDPHRAAVSLNVWPTRSPLLRHDSGQDYLEAYNFLRVFQHQGPLP